MQMDTIGKKYYKVGRLCLKIQLAEVFCMEYKRIFYSSCNRTYIKLEKGEHLSQKSIY